MLLHTLFYGAFLLPLPSFAAPTSSAVELVVRDDPLDTLLSTLKPNSLAELADIEAALGVIEANLIPNLNNFTKILATYQAFFGAIKPEAAPTALDQIASIISSIYGAGPGDAALGIAQLIRNSILPTNLFEIVPSSDDDNSSDNINPLPPGVPIYPSKSPSDAPYTVSEEKLRAAIKIPEKFQYGRNGKQPVLLIHGTGQTGGVNYLTNIGKLLTASSFADPVWLNVPTRLMQDAQISVEYIAYAINYISSLSPPSTLNITVIGWSQGTIDTQWTLKYWPSTRTSVSDFIALSPDFHGTVPDLVCPLFPLIPCDPALPQQFNTANFVAALRAKDGDAAYVPTTVVYTFFDESVQPTPNTPDASAWMLDTRGVGASNNQLQDICPGKAAGGVYTHSGVLYNPATWALIVDAMTHEGPADRSRVDLETVCGQVAADGLSVADVLATQALLGEAFVQILTYPDKVVEEPVVREYAL